MMDAYMRIGESAIMNGPKKMFTGGVFIFVWLKLIFWDVKCVDCMHWK